MDEQLIEECSNYIHRLTYYFEGYKSKEDLYQAGWIGLSEALKKFDASKDTKFTTYAYDFILGEMRKLIRQDKGIKISKNITKFYFKIEKYNIMLAQKLMRYPTTEELSNFSGIPEETIIDCIKTKNIMQSIDEPIISDGKELTLHDTISARKIDIDSNLMLKDALNNLSADERSLIEGRYIYDLTQEQMALQLGMSQVQVSRKEKKIKEKIKCLM